MLSGVDSAQTSFFAFLQVLPYNFFFQFLCQAQQLEWVKIHYPTLFEELKTYAAKGQFLPVGGTWVEMVK